jgi:hypothetical protein
LFLFVERRYRAPATSNASGTELLEISIGIETTPQSDKGWSTRTPVDQSSAEQIIRVRMQSGEREGFSLESKVQSLIQL